MSSVVCGVVLLNQLTHTRCVYMGGVREALQPKPLWIDDVEADGRVALACGHAVPFDLPLPAREPSDNKTISEAASIT